MIPFYGYVAASSTLYMPWHSFAAATGASSATTNFAAADVKIYKDGSTTERSSANGITATTDFDSRTGINLVAIDLSDNTDAGFYSASHFYAVCIDTVTIDGQTVRFWLGTFFIGVQPVNATQVGGTSQTGSDLGASIAAVPTANNNADALLDRTAGIEASRTLRQGLRLMLAALCGKASGLATTVAIYRDTNDLHDRITAVVDEFGNRASVTLDPS